jgi:hypothetical protein
MKKLNLTARSLTSDLKAGEVVRGRVTGTFRILGFRMLDGGEEYAQLVAVNPLNHNEKARGVLTLAVSNLRPL